MTIVVNTMLFIRVLIMYIALSLISFIIVYQSQLDNLRVEKSVVYHLLGNKPHPEFSTSPEVGIGRFN